MKAKRIFISIILVCLCSILIMPTYFGAEARMQQDLGMGFTTGTMDTHLITYSRKVETSGQLGGGMNAYAGNVAINGSCGPVAGAEIIGYFDRVYPDLIPNYSPTYTNNGSWAFKQYSETATDNAIKDLITKMKCKDGTTVANFKSGLTSYVSEKGCKTTITSCMDNYVLFENFFSKYKESIKNANPVLIGASPYYYANMGAKNSNADAYNYIYRSGSHAMVGYGYKTIEYYRYENVSEWSPVWYNPLRYVTVQKEVKFLTENLLMVQLGEGTGIINIDYKVDIFAAFGVKISK